MEGGLLRGRSLAATMPGRHLVRNRRSPLVETLAVPDCLVVDCRSFRVRRRTECRSGGDRPHSAGRLPHERLLFRAAQPNAISSRASSKGPTKPPSSCLVSSTRRGRSLSTREAGLRRPAFPSRSSGTRKPNMAEQRPYSRHSLHANKPPTAVSCFGRRRSWRGR